MLRDILLLCALALVPICIFNGNILHEKLIMVGQHWPEVDDIDYDIDAKRYWRGAG